MSRVMQKKIPPHSTIAVSQDGSILVSGNQVYDLTDKRNDVVPLSILCWDEHAALYPSIAISPDGKYVVTAHIGFVYADNAKLVEFTSHGDYYYDPPPEPENLILVWDTSTGQLVYQDSFTMIYKTPSSRVEVDNHSKFIHLEFLSNDKFVTVSESGEVAVWSVPLKKRVYALSASALKAGIFATNHTQDQFAIIESNPFILGVERVGQQKVMTQRRFPYGSYRVLGEGVGLWENLESQTILRLWTLSDGRLIKEVEKPKSDVILSMHFHPDDMILAMNDHQAIFLLDVESGMLIDRIVMACKLIGFTDDGQNLLVQKNDNQVNVWNINQERFYKNFAFPGEIYHTQIVTDNRVVVVTKEGKDSIVHVVDLGALIVE